MMWALLIVLTGVLIGVALGVALSEHLHRDDGLSADQLRAIYRREHQRKMDGRVEEWD